LLVLSYQRGKRYREEEKVPHGRNWGMERGAKCDRVYSLSSMVLLSKKITNKNAKMEYYYIKIKSCEILNYPCS
jgi:hypothetical protein